MPIPPYTEPLETSADRALAGRGGKKTYVYLASDERGRLLYVGITSDIYRRFGQHAAKAVWYPKMAHLATELYATRDQAARRERQLIERYDPPHNIMLRHGDGAYRNMARIADAKARRVPALLR